VRGNGHQRLYPSGTVIQASRQFECAHGEAKIGELNPQACQVRLDAKGCGYTNASKRLFEDGQSLAIIDDVRR